MANLPGNQSTTTTLHPKLAKALRSKKGRFSLVDAT